MNSEAVSSAWAETECNICYGSPDEPVVTLCGHLYCWRCLFTWMNTNRSSIICPVCKAGINQNMIVPIFNDIDVVQLSGASKWSEVQMDVARVAGEALLRGVNHSVAKGVTDVQSNWGKKPAGETDMEDGEDVEEGEYNQGGESVGGQTEQWGYGAVLLVSVGVDRELSPEDYKAIVGAVREFARQLGSRIVQAKLDSAN